MQFDQKKTMDRLANMTQKLSQISMKNMGELLDDEFWQEMQRLQQMGMNVGLPNTSLTEEQGAQDGRESDQTLIPAESHEMEFGPLIDIYQTKGKIIIHCAMPGLDRNSVKATLKDGRLLTIEGQVKENHFAENKEYVIKQERFFGKFIRQIRLPGNVMAKGATSSYHDGVLEMIFPRMSGKVEKQVMVPLTL